MNALIHPRTEGTHPYETQIPADFLRELEFVFHEEFAKTIQDLRRQFPNLSLQANGTLFAHEVGLALSLIEGAKSLGAVTLYVCATFSSGPNNRQDLHRVLGIMSDVLGLAFQNLALEEPTKANTNSTHPPDDEPLAERTTGLAGRLQVTATPWIPVPGSDELAIHYRVDTANPQLEKESDEWLRKNDPSYSTAEWISSFRESLEEEPLPPSATSVVSPQEPSCEYH